MKNPCPRIWVGLLLGAANNLAFAQAQTGQQPPSGNIVPVDNFIPPRPTRILPHPMQ